MIKNLAIGCLAFYLAYLTGLRPILDGVVKAQGHALKATTELRERVAP